MIGRVDLVGGGPGDPSLLTLKAYELLKACDVVAYDELIAPAILEMANARAERLAVGRRHGAGVTSYKLHPAVIARAKEGKHVVRLKAGDPMIFGRGGEEAEELAAAGVPFSIVPGISAALGAASYAGVPLTHRDCASHVTFATGHDVDGSHGHAARRTEGTTVLYMAARKLGANLRALVDAGRAGASTPAAYVAAATTPGQRVIEGTVADLETRVSHVDPLLPAIVIVGEVVGVRERLRRAREGGAR